MNLVSNYRKDCSTVGWPPRPDFWENDFRTATSGCVEPFLFKGILPKQLRGTKDFTEALKALQRSFRDKKSTPARLRVYMDETRHDDLIGKVLSTDSLEEESVDSFARRVLEAEKFCLVVNNLETLNENLAAQFGVFLQSMFKTHGVPIGGCEQVAFAGNYAGTPFGVHEGFEHAFLMHLGPGVKDFYCWSQSDYVRLTGGRAPTFGDYAHLLSSATKFVLEPGDALYLPALVYHVGRQTEFSISIATPLYTYPTERYFLRALLPQLAESMLASVEGGPSRYEPLHFDKEPLTGSLSPLAAKLITALGKHIDRELPPLLAYRWFSLLSNGGWEISQENRPIDGGSSGRDASNAGLVRLKKPFRLCWSELDCASGQLRVFLRGLSLCVDNSEETRSLLSDLNEKGEVSLGQDPNARRLFAAISRLGGLQFEEHKAQ